MVATLAARAQTIENYSIKLGLPAPESGARVVAREDSPSRRATSFDAPRQERVAGFRVCIFVDNSQSARSAATATQSQVVELFPSVPVYVSYPNPDWKVTAGDCLTRAEATVLLGRLRPVFPKAFIVNDMIPLSAFIKAKPEELPE